MNNYKLIYYDLPRKNSDIRWWPIHRKGDMVVESTG